MKTYNERILFELMKHVNNMRRIQKGWVVGDKLVKKSNQRKMWKLLKYARRSNPGLFLDQIYFSRITGRINRTPWKCKGLQYVTKAKRAEREERFAKVLGFLNGK